MQVSKPGLSLCCMFSFTSLDWRFTTFNSIPIILIFSTIKNPRHRLTVDHGTIVFHYRPCLTMVGDGMTVLCDHGVLLALDHGTLLFNQFIQLQLVNKNQGDCVPLGMRLPTLKAAPFIFAVFRLSQSASSSSLCTEVPPHSGKIDFSYGRGTSVHRLL